MMIFKRNLHPVGHGAFFTEQFINNDGESIFHMAYDCGSFSKDSLYRVIDRIENHFDILFVSHFDNDHINGIKRLIERRLINCETIVVIPFLYPRLIKIMLPELKDEMSPEVFDALEVLFDSEARIIGFDNRTTSFISEIIGSRVNGRIIFSDISSITRKLNNLGENCYWIYVPYNTITNDGRENRFIKDWFNNFGSEEFTKEVSLDVFEKSFIDTRNSLKDFFTDSNGNFDDSKYNSFISKLKELYKNASPPMKGVTAINMNSLNLLSFGSPVLTTYKNLIHILEYSKNNYEIMKNSYSFFQWKGKENDAYKLFMNEIHKKNYYNTAMSLSSFSALYTGDCVMEVNFFENIDLICRDVIKSPIGLLQIPHHGSKYNYNQLILSKPILSSFINFNSSRKVSNNVKEIESDFFMICRPCFEITQDDDSCFEQSVIWDGE